MDTVTCPRCDARWAGHKTSHCPGGKRTPDCHLTFSSTRAGDRHLVDMDESGWSRHLTPAEMLTLRRKDGNPWYQMRINAYGTEVWGEYGPKGRPFMRREATDGSTGGK